MTVLMFFCAILLSGVAAFFSVAGLMAIFSASPVSIAVMGSILEVSKLVVASWLYRNWKPIPTLMKSYLTIAIVILMALTSLGTFGWLSKAHGDQALVQGDVAYQLAFIDEKIKTEKDNILSNQAALKQLDTVVDQAMSRSTTETGVSRSVYLRKTQSKERDQIKKNIDQSQSEIAKLNQERLPIAAQNRKVEAEVGPIKYIAAMIYNDQPDQTSLEKAVRFVIIMIVSVFDPLAVVMLIAANWSFVHNSKKKPVAFMQHPAAQRAQPEEPIQNIFEPSLDTTPEPVYNEVLKAQIGTDEIAQENDHVIEQQDSSLEESAPFWRSRPKNYFRK